MWSISRLQSSLNILPEDSSLVAASLRPAQVGLPLQELPHAVVWGELVGRDLLQEQKDQNILLLVEETKAAGESSRLRHTHANVSPRRQVSRGGCRRRPHLAIWISLEHHSLCR